MLKLKEGERIIYEKWGKISVICLIVAIVSFWFPKKIKIVNSICTFDEMCIENTFEEIKVWTDDQPLPEKNEKNRLKSLAFKEFLCYNTTVYAKNT